MDQMIGSQTRIDSTQKSILKGRRVIGDQQSLIRRFKAELHCCADDIQDPEKLRKGVETPWAKHAQYVEADSGEGVDKGVKEEFAARGQSETDARGLAGELPARC